MLEMAHDDVHALLPIIPRHHQMPKLIHRAVQVDTAVASPGQGGCCHLGGPLPEAHVVQGAVRLGTVTWAFNGLGPGSHANRGF